MLDKKCLSLRTFATLTNFGRLRSAVCAGRQKHRSELALPWAMVQVVSRSPELQSWYRTKAPHRLLFSLGAQVSSFYLHFSIVSKCVYAKEQEYHIWITANFYCNCAQNPRVSLDSVAMYCAKHVKRNYSINEWNRKTEKRNKTRRRGNNFNRMSELVIELGQEKPSSEPTSPL